MLALEKAKQADAATLTSLVTYMIPQISTSVGVNDVIPLVKDIKKYHIGDTAGFPFSRQTMRVGRMDCVIPTTLESNVVMLHQFLYGEDTSYRPSSAVKKISAHISEETGLYEEGKAAPSGEVPPADRPAARPAEARRRSRPLLLKQCRKQPWKRAPRKKQQKRLKQQRQRQRSQRKHKR